MYWISGIVNILLLLIIFGLGNHDMQNAVYEIPAMIAVIIAWVCLIKGRKSKK